jgi:hypothetical protein
LIYKLANDKRDLFFRKKSTHSLHLELQRPIDEIYSTDPIYKTATKSTYEFSDVLTQIIRPPNTGGVATELSGMLVSGCVLTLSKFPR